jgi:hypothetical protein
MGAEPIRNNVVNIRDKSLCVVNSVGVLGYGFLVELLVLLGV